MSPRDKLSFSSWEAQEPPPGFTDQVMLAIEKSARHTTSTSGEVPVLRRRLTRTTSLVAATAAALVSLAAAAAVTHYVKRFSEPRTSTKSATTPSSPLHGELPAIIHSGSEAQDSAAPIPVIAPTALVPKSVVDRRRHDEISARRAALGTQGVRRDPATGLTLPDGINTGVPQPKFTKEYVQATIRDSFMPLAKSCYADALERDPKLGGRITFDFMIVGDAEVGGIIDQIEVKDSETTLHDPDFVTCVRESLMAVVFQAPEGNGVVTVSIPIDFAPRK